MSYYFHKKFENLVGFLGFLKSLLECILYTSSYSCVHCGITCVTTEVLMRSKHFPCHLLLRIPTCNTIFLERVAFYNTCVRACTHCIEYKIKDPKLSWGPCQIERQQVPRVLWAHGHFYLGLDRDCIENGNIFWGADSCHHKFILSRVPKLSFLANVSLVRISCFIYARQFCL